MDKKKIIKLAIWGSCITAVCGVTIGGIVYSVINSQLKQYTVVDNTTDVFNVQDGVLCGLQDGVNFDTYKNSKGKLCNAIELNGTITNANGEKITYTKIADDAFKCSNDAGTFGNRILDLKIDVQEIGESAFFHTSVNSVILSDKVTSIGANAFGECKLSDIEISETNSNYGIATDVFNGCVTVSKNEEGKSSWSGNNPVVGCLAAGILEFKSQWDYTGIDANSFINCWGITGVLFSTSIEHINTNAFVNCQSLKRIEWSKIGSVDPDQAFDILFQPGAFVNLPSKGKLVLTNPGYARGGKKWTRAMLKEQLVESGLPSDWNF